MSETCSHEHEWCASTQILGVRLENPSIPWQEGMVVFVYLLKAYAYLICNLCLGLVFTYEKKVKVVDYQ